MWSIKSYFYAKCWEIREYLIDVLNLLVCTSLMCLIAINSETLPVSGKIINNSASNQQIKEIKFWDFVKCEFTFLLE